MRVSLFLNHACNLACRYCYNGEHFSRAMPWDVAKAGVELALAQPGSKHRVSFFGGEPLLEMALIRRVMDYCAQRKDETGIDLYHLVVSNAVLLDEEKLGYFLDNDVYVAVSVDGCRQAHEATRCFADGSSSYDRVRANATRLFAERPGNKVIAVIDPLNVDWLGDSFDALLGMGARNLSMNVNYEGRWEEPERARFERALRQLGDRYIAAYRRGAAFTLNMLDSKIVTHLKLGYADGDRCDFGCEEVAVSPRGRLYPCDRLVGMDDQDDIVIGDVFEGIDHRREEQGHGRLRRLRRGAPLHALVRLRQPRHDRLGGGRGRPAVLVRAAHDRGGRPRGLHPVPGREPRLHQALLCAQGAEPTRGVKAPEAPSRSGGTSPASSAPPR
jgi:uncharacterized protein